MTGFIKHNSCRCKWNVKAVLILQLNKYTESLLKNHCGYYIWTLSTLYVLLPLGDKLFMSVMAFCWSCPFPSSNPGSNKRGLTSVTRAYKSPLLQMESATESEVWRSAGRGGRGKVWKMGKLLEENNINARRCANEKQQERQGCGRRGKEQKREKNNGEGRGFQQVVRVCQIIKIYAGAAQHLINSKHSSCHRNRISPYGAWATIALGYIWIIITGNSNLPITRNCAWTP